MAKAVINLGGKVIFKCDEVGYRCAGLCAVKKNRKWGLIDTNGKIVVPLAYDKIFGPADGRWLFKINGKSGFMDYQGNIAIAPVYDDAHCFENGVAKVKKGDKWGAIAPSGRQVYPFISSDDDFDVPTEGLIGIQLGTKEGKNEFGFVDGEGKIVIPIIRVAGSVMPFHQGLAVFSDVVGGKMRYGFIDTTGAIAIPLKFTRASYFSEERATVAIDEGVGAKRGVIDTHGNWIVEPRYDYISEFKNGFAVVGNNKKYGLISRNGTEVTPCLFSGSEIGAFGVDAMLRIAYGKIGNKCYFYNLRGQKIFEISGNRVELLAKSDENEASIEIIRDNQYFFYDCNGRLLFGGYDCVFPFFEGRALAKKNGKQYVIDKKGTVLYELPDGVVLYDCKYGEIKLSENTLFIKKGTDGRITQLVDVKGHVLFECHTIDRCDVDKSSGLIAVRVDDYKKLTTRWGYINPNGKIAIPLKFKNAGTFNGGFAEVETIPRAGNESTSAKSVSSHNKKQEESGPKGCIVLILAVVGLACLLTSFL
ncbi:MAG: WG repeat-containing protein [Bacteroides sp.]|nr:WG repeat-containing protein [Bacteroides sp.]MCM1457664.1 WG repeat-containing protein [Lachnoclostridium sp.]